MHIAGPYLDQRQLCKRCGRELLDNRRAVTLVGSGPPGHFEEGALLWQSGGCLSLRTDNDDNTPPCRPVN
jgi:hypothetical protein